MPVKAFACICLTIFYTLCENVLLAQLDGEKGGYFIYVALTDFFGQNF